MKYVFLNMLSVVFLFTTMNAVAASAYTPEFYSFSYTYTSELILAWGNNKNNQDAGGTAYLRQNSDGTYDVLVLLNVSVATEEVDGQPVLETGSESENYLKDGSLSKNNVVVSAEKGNLEYIYVKNADGQMIPIGYKSTKSFSLIDPTVVTAHAFVIPEQTYGTKSFEEIPIDGGLGFLLAAGIGFGAWFTRKRKK